MHMRVPTLSARIIPFPEADSDGYRLLGGLLLCGRSFDSRYALRVWDRKLGEC